MKFNFKKHKYMYIGIIILLLIIAGLFDLKYEGLFYKLLPESIQTFVNRII